MKERMKKVCLVSVLVVLMLGAFLSLFTVKTNAATLMEEPLIRPTAGATATPNYTILTAEACEQMVSVAMSQSESGYLCGIGVEPKTIYFTYAADTCEYRYYLIATAGTFSFNCYGSNPTIFGSNFCLFCWDSSEGWKLMEMRNTAVWESPRPVTDYLWVNPSVSILSLPDCPILESGNQSANLNTEPIGGPYTQFYKDAKALAENWTKLAERTEMSVEQIKNDSYYKGWNDGQAFCSDGHEDIYNQGFGDGWDVGVKENNQAAYDKGYIKGYGNAEQEKLDKYYEGYEDGKDYGEKSGIITLEAFYGFLATVITAPYQMLILSLDFTLFGVHVGKACAAVAGVTFALVTLAVIKRLVGKS